MVGPICINHTNFGDCWVSVLALKIVLTELDIIVIHSKTVLINEICKAFFIQVIKSVKSFNCGWNIILINKCFILL